MSLHVQHILLAKEFTSTCAGEDFTILFAFKLELANTAEEKNEFNHANTS